MTVLDTCGNVGNVYWEVQGRRERLEEKLLLDGNEDQMNLMKTKHFHEEPYMALIKSSI